MNLGSFMPTVELRYRKQPDDNREGAISRFEEEAIEVAMSMNLYRGGQDKARSREAHNLYFTALEIQKNACRVVRRDLLEAYNEVMILIQRLAILKNVIKTLRNAPRKPIKRRLCVGTWNY